MQYPDELILGIDVGGSHITVGLVNLHTKMVLKESCHRAPVDSWAEAEQILDTWSTLIKKAFNKVDIRSKKIGMAMPGPFDYKRGISYIRGNKKYDDLYGLNIKDLLAQKLNIVPENILMFNDAECFLKGEVFAGAAQDRHKAIAITLGTGLGTAICNNGSTKDAGLWDSPFLDSIAEEYLSTRWFLKEYFQRSGINIANVKELSEICATSAIARSVFKDFAESLAVFLESFIRAENADVVVIGGNISKASPKFLPHLITSLEKRNITVPVRITRLGELAALLGAASYWADPQYHVTDIE